MRHTLIFNAVIAGLLLSTTAFSQDETDSEHSAAEMKHHNKGENKHHKNKGDFSSRVIKKIDTDEDGQVSAEEYMAHAEQRFNDLDINGDGFVTTEEAKEASKIMREKRKEARSMLKERKSDSETKSDSE